MNAIPLDFPQSLDKGAYQRAAGLLREIAGQATLECLMLLRDGEMSVSEVQDAMGIHQTRSSQLLLSLLRSGVLDVRRDANRRYYRLTHPGVAALLDTVSGLYVSK